MKYLKHSTAEVLTNRIGDDTKVWQFVVILDGAEVGRNCNICSHVFIEDGVLIGNNVTIKNGTRLYSGLTIENDVFIGPNVTFTNDKYPQSKNVDFKLLKTTIKHNASIGAGATILPGITISEYATVGAGAVVTKNVAPHTIVAGNPAVVLRQ